MKLNLMIFGGMFLLSFLVTFLLGKKFIPALMRIKMGQTILEIGPRWHKSKEGTPILGGLFFIGGILVSLLVFGVALSRREGDATVYKVFLMMALQGAVGFIDDFIKFVKKRNKGLSAMQKLVMQFAAAGLFLYLMKDSLTTALTVPFTSFKIELGLYYWAFSMLFIVFIVNSVNLTDGIDGLAASVTFVLFVFFSVIALKEGEGTKTALFAAVCGGMGGFLVYNFYPARVFMGDTGSLFLGGAVVGVAYWLDKPLIIVVCGFVFILEALSVVIQVAVFKLTKKRVFKMAPFHHHLEMCGWKEPQIVMAACLFTAALCIASYFA